MKKWLLIGLAAMMSMALSLPLSAREVRTLTLPDQTEVDLRIFPAPGDTLLLGFPCDEGTGVNEEKTARELAGFGVETWMPDLLGAYMLPKVKSSLKKIPTQTLLFLIDRAVRTGKQVFLIAGGPDSELILRAAAEWEKTHPPGKDALKGAILLFPRLIKGQPTPGQVPQYVDVVGHTRLPIMVLEGERTPNRWGIGHLTRALQAGGSNVYAKLIPGVRGYFFKREDTTAPEEIVTQQLSGLINASLYFLKGSHHELH